MNKITFEKKDGYTIANFNGEEMSRAKEIEMPGDSELQDSVSITPTTEAQTITPDEGYDGFKEANVSAVDPSQYQKPEESCNVTPTTSAQTITPASGKVFNEVNVSAVDSTIDANIQAGNIKKDVSILGITGSYEGSGGDGLYIKEQTLSVTKYNSIISAGSTSINVSKYTLNTEKTIKLKSLKGLLYHNSSSGTLVIDVPDGTYDLYYKVSSFKTGSIKVETINNIKYITFYSFSYDELVIKYNSLPYLLLIGVDYTGYNIIVEKSPSIELGSYTSTTITGNVNTTNSVTVRNVDFQTSNIVSSKLYIDTLVNNKAYLPVCDLTYIHVTQPQEV